MILYFSPLAIGLFRFSGFLNLLFRLKEPILLKRMLHWCVGTLKSSTCVPVFSQIVGRQIGHNQTGDQIMSSKKYVVVYAISIMNGAMTAPGFCSEILQKGTQQV